MKLINTHGNFEDILAKSDENSQKLAYALRSLILEVYPNAYEVPWAKQFIAGYGIGPKKMSEHFAYIAAQKTYVSLGFYYGAELPDPENLMEGTGKLLRHVKIRNEAELENPALRHLLELSTTHRMPEHPSSED